MRTRRRLLRWLAGTFVLIGGGLVLFVWALMQPPEFYQHAMAVPEDVRTRRSEAEQLVVRTTSLVERIRNSDDGWSEEFTQTEINAWLAEELPRNFSEWLPQGVSEPRVKLSDETVQIGFKLVQEDWEGVVSLQVRPWVVSQNQLALEIESIRAGLIPIPLDGVLDELEQMVETDGWQIERLNSDGKQVIQVNLDQDDSEGPALTSIRVVDDRLQVIGTSEHPEAPVVFQAPRVARQ